MTKAELIEALEDVGDDAEVRIMQQPSWPFEYAVQGAVTLGQIHRAESDHGTDEEDLFVPSRNSDRDPILPGTEVVYLVEGQQIMYGTKAAWDALDR